MPTSFAPSSDEPEQKERKQHQSNTSPSTENREQPPNDATAAGDIDTETPPDYSRHADGLPSYARVTRNDQRRRESLRAFVENKMYTEDTFGGHKGIVRGPPNDPAKPFQWIQRKLKGEKDVWRKLSEEERRKWEEAGGAVDHEAGEVARGDMNTSRIL